VADDNPRVDELRRRVQQDPASIAFAHLADEHRRAGDLLEAVRVCRAGLEHHPTYLLAHVTLGRALMELTEYGEARAEFEYVLRAAPDNLIALKGMQELHQKDPAHAPAPQGAGVARAPLKLRPDTEDASPGKNAPLNAYPQEVANTSVPQAKVGPPPQALVASLPEAVSAYPLEVASTSAPQAKVEPPPAAPVAPPSEAVSAYPLEVASTPALEAKVEAPPEAAVASPPPKAVDPALDELEGWLAALDAGRAKRG
jgi:tetratricopeptide (TPR) repeat protein